MTDDEQQLETCPYRGGDCPDHAHAWREGICPPPPNAITTRLPDDQGDPE